MQMRKQRTGSVNYWHELKMGREAGKSLTSENIVQYESCQNGFKTACPCTVCFCRGMAAQLPLETMHNQIVRSNKRTTYLGPDIS